MTTTPTLTIPMITTPTTTPTPTIPMYNEKESTQSPVITNDATSQGPILPVMPVIDDDELIKLRAAELLKAVQRRRERDLKQVFSDYAKDIKPMALRCADAARSGDDGTLEIVSEEMIDSLRLLLLKFKRILNENKQSQQYSQTLNNRTPVVIPKDLPFDIMGQATVGPPPSHRFHDVNYKVTRNNNNFRDSGSVFMTTANLTNNLTTSPTIIKQRKRKRHDSKGANSSPVKSKKANKGGRANALWTDKEIEQLTVRVYKYAPNVLAKYPSLTLGQLAERIAHRVSKGDHHRTPSAVTKKMRNLGLVLTHPKNETLIEYLNENSLMQFVPKRFQPNPSPTHSAAESMTPPPTTTTVPSKSVVVVADKCYTEEEIAQAESKEPTTALAALIASLPVPVPVST